MKQFKNLTVVGTSHVAVESLKEVTEVILKTQPKVVALELDRKRFFSLMSEKKRKVRFSDIAAMGVKAFLFTLIGSWIQNKIGNLVKVNPGSEMKLGAKLAREIDAKIALIDRDISVTLKRLFKKLTRKEKWRFVKDIFIGIFSKKKARKELAKFDLRKVPGEKLIDELIGKVKDRYPTFHNVLIAERNEYMAKNLNKLINTYKTEKIVAIVGAGHEKEIIKIVKKLGEEK